MAKSSRAAYAQLRRDNENAAREALKVMIPEHYHNANLISSGESNASTKVFVAAKNYLSDKMVSGPPVCQIQYQTEPPSIEKSAGGVGPECGFSTPRAGPFQIPSLIQPSDRSDDRIVNEQIRQLRQVTTRLVHKAEEKIQAGYGTCDAFKTIVDNASDQMIDVIEAVENVK